MRLLNVISFAFKEKLRWGEGVFRGWVVAGSEMVKMGKPFSKGIKLQQNYSVKILLQSLYTFTET